MNILMLSDVWRPYVGGGVSVADHMSKELAKRGHHVDLVVPMGNPEEGKRRVRPLLTTEPTTWRRLLWSIRIPFHLHCDYDVVYVHSNMPAISGKVLSSTCRIPVVLHIHGAYNMTFGGPFWKRVAERCLFTIPHYDLILTVTRDFLRFPTRSRVVFLPNGVEYEKFAEARKTLRKAHDSLRVLYVGRLTRLKGIHVLLEALKHIRKHLEGKVDVRIVGVGPMEAFVRDYITRHSLGFVRFLGRLDDKALLEEYANADVFVMPSITEAFGIVLLEAGASGVPIISTATGEAPYILDEETGWLIPPGDARALAKALLDAIQTPRNMLQQMGTRLQKRIKERYSWERVAEIAEDYIMSIV